MFILIINWRDSDFSNKIFFKKKLFLGKFLKQMIFKDIIRKKTSLLWISEEKISLRIDFKQLFLNWFKKKSIFRFSSNSVLNYRKRKISNKIISEHRSSNLGSQIEFSLVLDEYTGQNFKIPKNSEISKILSFREAFSFNIYQSISKITPFFQSYEKDGLDFFCADTVPESSMKPSPQSWAWKTSCWSARFSCPGVDLPTAFSKD